ncbi:MAG: imidazole glycerol phosphate synthase subunit HisH [Candidatus Gygaella obscura]|nr:imidazole glycerol phosphate synthase subunit HisH [Candidatus Gygaella obscura]
MIVVVDYASGNLNSVSKALKKFGNKVKISSKPADIMRSEKLVLPGVGAFGDAAVKLKKLKLITPLKEFILSGRPFLGICLGMQLLFERSEESMSIKGLGVFKGSVRRFKANKNIKVPHIGWNEVSLNKDNKSAKKLFKDIKNKEFVYFCHSYYVDGVKPAYVAGNTSYSRKFVSAVSKDNVFAVQFHPEKSQQVGLKILKNFIAL